MARLIVVGRNPKPGHKQRRWHQLACDFGRRLYVVEELLVQGNRTQWAQAAALEVICGGSAVA